ncbi:helix-turn-helix domain-containing protein [Brachybacterium alimentarium]|uniref:helix-turn-helix domain-containing protein n=1 Tax=Brachybacterium alimentarium TaxID=47845 RepID=UPI003FD3DAAA
MATTNTPLTELIQSKGYSVHGLAQASGIPNTTLRRHLADGDFTVTQLRRIAKTLGVTPALVLSLAENCSVEHRSAA